MKKKQYKGHLKIRERRQKKNKVHKKESHLEEEVKRSIFILILQ